MFAGQFASRAPYTALGMFAGSVGSGAIAYNPESNPFNGVIEGTTTSTSSTASLARDWTRDTRTTLVYSYTGSDHQGASRFTQRDQQGGADFASRIGRTLDYTVAYRVSTRDATRLGVTRKDLVHSLTGGVAVMKQLSPTRALSGSVGGGGELTQPRNGAGRYWSPTWYGMIGVDVGRSWNVSASYRESSLVLHSPLVTPESYLTRAMVLSSGGALNGRIDVVLNAGYSDGGILVTPTSGARDHFQSYTAASQLRVVMWGGLSTIVSVNKYWSELTGPTSQLLGTGGQYQQTSVRVGLAWSAALHDSLPRQAVPRRRR